ncbi:hypothetical protein NC651_040109 [Populus alba x Populus x berolinensis]|nr:hypothetical protein NC651_040109 [Populus alba x Populus x berolinensis]
MTSSSPSSPHPSSLLTSSSSFHLLLSPSIRQSTSTKLDYLYEVNLPLVNPYHAFVKKSPSVIRNIKTLIKQPSRVAKEYVQASSFDHHKIPATSREQFVTLEIPTEFTGQWISQGYMHIHFGAIRLALSYHGRKGLPIAVRLALLDTRYLEYQHACIGSLETTLNCGTVVQLQITSADQVQDTYQATLHYQMAYRYSLLPMMRCLSLLIPINKLPVLMSRDKSRKRTYKKPEFTKKVDGTVEIIFKKGESSTSPPGIFSSSISMVQPASAPLSVPVESFSKDGCPVYAFSQDNHVFWDICSCESCCNEDLEADFPKHKRKSSGQKLKVRYNHGDRTIDTLGQPFSKFDYLVKYTPPSWEPPEQVPTFSMYQPTNSYDDDFPAL